MTIAIAWLLFPLVLLVLSLGCGLLLERAAGTTLATPLLVPAGFAVVLVTAQFATLSDRTAELAAPTVVGLAAAGLVLSWPWRSHRLPAAPIVAALAVFGVFAAPVLLSGEATFAGYIKLDDTANYMVMLDRAMEHGYDTSGLAPSTYEATVKTLLDVGYPLGSVVPLGVGRTLVALDPLWLWQPYLTFLAALVALGLYQLVAGLVHTPALRVLATVLGAQAALLYGYALWGGVKELLTSALVVLAAALVPATARSTRPRAVLPLATACAALLGVLSVGGAAWLAPPLVAALLIALAHGRARAVRTAGAFAGATAVLALPSLVTAATWLGENPGGYTSEESYGNLLQRLSWLQAFGIWPNDDFRLRPDALDVTYVLVGVAAAAVGVAIVLAVRRRVWEVPIALAAAALACALYAGLGSPWIGGKALASASPIVLTAALAAIAAVFESGRRVEAIVAVAVVGTGVVWSNVLQYSGVLLAPSSRLAELETIGERFAGRGPALLTEFEPYGARHFLRRLDAEGASELRRNYVHLRAGGIADTGVSPDVDEIALASLLDYRTIVARRSPVTSRPPSSYSRVWSGAHYEVWQRAEKPRPILRHLSLGHRLEPAAEPRCRDVLRVAELAGDAGGIVAAVVRPRAIVLQADGTRTASTSFGRYGADPKAIHPEEARTIETTFPAPSPGRYGVWVGGSFRAGARVSIDGAEVGGDRHQLNWPGNFTHVGDVDLARGRHAFRFEYSGPDMYPGSSGRSPFGLGPFAIARGTADRSVTYLAPAEAGSLCGRTLDWLEALGR